MMHVASDEPRLFKEQQGEEAEEDSYQGAESGEGDTSGAREAFVVYLE